MSTSRSPTGNDLDAKDGKSGVLGRLVDMAVDMAVDTPAGDGDDGVRNSVELGSSRHLDNRHPCHNRDCLHSQGHSHQSLARVGTWPVAYSRSWRHSQGEATGNDGDDRGALGCSLNHSKATVR